MQKIDIDNKLIYMKIIRHHNSHPNWHGNKKPMNKIGGFIENIDALKIFLLKIMCRSGK